MPIYCFKDEKSGQVVTKLFSMQEVPECVILDNGNNARRSIRDEHNGVRHAKNWPLECEASGVSPEQAQELSKVLSDAGVPTEVNSEGNPIYRDARHRFNALRARGLHDKNGVF